MKERKISINDDILLNHLSNKLASYHQVIRDNFNYGNNKYYLDFNHSNWLFDPNVKPIYCMSKKDKINWFSSVNPFSVFIASENINPLETDSYIQRTGICLIESAEIKYLMNRIKDGYFLSEEEAIKIISSYPSESQLLGVKPILNSEIVVYFEDVLFEKMWNQFTNGLYNHSQNIQNAFKKQIKRTESVVTKYIRLMHPKNTPNIKFIKYSDIFSDLDKEVKTWINTLLKKTPYKYNTKEKFYIPTAAYVLYTYGGESLIKISKLSESKKIVLVRQLSHCVLEKGWTKNKSKVMDWFRDAILNYYKNNPQLMVGYLDLFDNQAGCCYKDTPLENKVHYGNLQKKMLIETIDRPFPLWENKIFQRGVVCDFDPEILDNMLWVGLLNSSYVYSGRPKEQKEYIKKEIRKGLLKIYQKYSKLILPLFESK